MNSQKGVYSRAHIRLYTPFWLCSGRLRVNMNSEQIEKNLGLLAQKMDELGITGTILLLGGAVMVAIVKNRPSTRDIDIVVATNDAQQYRAIKRAISLVAQENRLPDE